MDNYTYSIDGIYTLVFGEVDDETDEEMEDHLNRVMDKVIQVNEQLIITELMIIKGKDDGYSVIGRMMRSDIGESRLMTEIAITNQLMKIIHYSLDGTLIYRGKEIKQGNIDELRERLEVLIRQRG